MLVHLGGDVTVHKKEIVAILNSEVGEAPSTKEFLRAMRDEGRLINLAGESKRRSIVITSDKVYITHLSCSALKRRAENLLLED